MSFVCVSHPPSPALVARSYTGDAYCDDGSYDFPDLNCDTFNYDNGDCATTYYYYYNDYYYYNNYYYDYYEQCGDCADDYFSCGLIT